jgi:hypothetical protein
MNRRGWYSVGFIQKGKRVVFEFQVVILTLLGVSIDNQEKDCQSLQPRPDQKSLPIPKQKKQGIHMIQADLSQNTHMRKTEFISRRIPSHLTQSLSSPLVTTVLPVSQLIRGLQSITLLSGVSSSMVLLVGVY